MIFLVPRDAHVALLAPLVAPRVLGEPEVLTGHFIVAVADDKQRVAGEEPLAHGLRVDATLVQLKGAVAGVDAGGHGADSRHRLLQRALAAQHDAGETADFGRFVAALAGARFSPAKVGVGGLAGDAAVLLRELESALNQPFKKTMKFFIEH